jgi:hypothetical protein
MRFHDNFYVQLGSSPGTFGIVVSTGELAGTPWALSSTATDDPIMRYAQSAVPFSSPLWGEFDQKFANFGGTLEGSIVIPCWFSVLLVTTLAVAPWVRWRFTLRTLLIATTLVAVLLALIAALNKMS